MPGCAAVHCSNSSEKGFPMKRFPRDPGRRRQWQIDTRRDNWTPSDNSNLCEGPFAADMWERTRVDGTRALKWNAEPTVFSFSELKISIKPTIEMYCQEETKPLLHGQYFYFQNVVATNSSKYKALFTFVSATFTTKVMFYNHWFMSLHLI
nr:unnamed protein product [Callosobruchus analis]